MNASHTGGKYAGRAKNGDATASLGLLLDVKHRGAGLRVAEVLRQGPADRDDSRIKPGVLITHVNGQRLSEFELVTANGQQEARGGRLPLDPGKYCQDGAGAHGMRGVGHIPLRLQRAEIEGCRGIDTGVGKDHSLAFPQIERMLDL